MKLERNSSKMGMRPRGKTWEWYTAKVGLICSIHIHNQARSGLWIYEIHAFSVLRSRKFDTKELAYEAGLNRLRALLEASLKELEEVLE